MRLWLAGVVVCLPLLAGMRAPVHAQVKPSERATVSQTVDGTVISVDYARPRARGREEIFGGVVHWGELWTPGANDATVLDLSRDVTIEGHAVPAGRWSVWIVVREEEPWEVVLDPRADRWHTARPEETDLQIRFPVATEATDSVETLLWYFPEVRRSGATLVMTWADVRVPLEIEVEPTYRYTMAEEEALPFLGAWEMERVRGTNTDRIRTVEIIHHEDGSLRLVGTAGASMEWVLQPRTEGIFALGWTRNGELWSGSSTLLEMVYEGATPVAFTVRGSNDQVTWRGKRKP